MNCHYATLYTGTHALVLYMRMCYNIMRNAYMRVIRMCYHCVHTRHHHIMNLDMMMSNSRLNLDQKMCLHVPLDLEQIC